MAVQRNQTLGQLLEYARMSHGPRGDIASDELADQLATGVIDLLGEAAPCGWEAPQVLEDAGVLERVGVPNQWATDWVTAEDARAFARMLLAAADEADQRTNGAKQ